MGIKLNISKFTYNYNVGIGQVGYNYTYNESEYSSWSLGYGLNGFKGYMGIENIIQNDDGVQGSTEFTGSFDSLPFLISQVICKIDLSILIPKNEIIYIISVIVILQIAQLPIENLIFKYDSLDKAFFFLGKGEFLGSEEGENSSLLISNKDSTNSYIYLRKENNYLSAPFIQPKKFLIYLMRKIEQV